MTRREAEVLDALADRLTNREVAARLFVSERTVESHVSSLLRKLQCESRLELGEVAKTLRAEADRALWRLPPTLELALESGVMVGRVAELDAVHRLWLSACGGRFLTAVVVGEAGIGKTRLIAEAAARVREMGGLVLAGACYEDLHAPFGPFVEALEPVVDSVPIVDLEEWIGPFAAGFTHLWPGVTETLEAPGDAERPVERGEIYRAVQRFLAGLAEARPVLLVVEDIHWAAESTLDLLRHLARAGHQSRVLLVTTARDTAPDLNEALNIFLGDAARIPAAEVVTLHALGRAEVGQMIDSLGSRADAASVLTQSGGVPLFIRELAVQNSAHQVSTIAGLIARRESLLTPQDSRLLDLAAAVGTRFRADLLARASGWDLVEVLEALERAEAAGLVAALPDRAGRFEHRHALFRTARYEALAVSQRVRLHGAIARALEFHIVDRLGSAELAHHACLGAPIVGPRVAIGHARGAAGLAEAAAAFDDAAALYGSALTVAEQLDPPDPATRLKLSIDLGRALNRLGDPGHRTVLLDAARVARALEDYESMGEIVWAMSQEGTSFDPGRTDPQLAEITDTALAHLDSDSVVRPKVLAAAAEERWLGGQRSRGREYAEEALRLAQQHQDLQLIAEVLVHTRAVRWLPGAETNRLVASRLIEIGQRTHNAGLVAQGAADRTLAAIERGDLKALDAHLIDLHDALDAAGMPFNYLQVQHVGYRATRHVWTGELAAAEQHVDDMAILAQRSGRHPSLLMGPLLVVVRHNQGRLAERIGPMEAFLSDDRPGFRDYSVALLALAYAHAGRLADASLQMWRLLERPSSTPPDMFWLAGRVLLAEVAEIAQDPEAGTALGADLDPFSGAIAATFNLGLSPVDLARAQAALAAGDLNTCENAAQRVEHLSRTQGMPIFLARSLLRIATARRLRNPGAKTSQHASPVGEALRIADTTRAELIRQEAARLQHLN